MNMSKNYVSKVIKIAKAEVGYLEKSKTAYQKNPSILYEKAAGAGSDNYTKYGKEMHEIYPAVMDFPAYWCDAFCDWCFFKAYGVSNAKKLLAGDFNDYTVASAQLYKNKKAYYKSPQVGDQIFFNNGIKICHTGIVYKVAGNYVYTIEGNTSGASGVVSNGGGVAKKKYLKTYNRIDGYGRPKYDAEIVSNAATSTTSAIKKTTNPYAEPMAIIKSGAKGTSVKWIQFELNQAGYNLDIDGIFGSKTLKAVKSFQKKMKLTADGIVGAKTKKALKDN